LQVGVQGLQILKPHLQKDFPSSVLIANGGKEFTNGVGGIGVEVRLILGGENVEDEMANWEVENLKFSVKQPVMRISYLWRVVSFLYEGCVLYAFSMQIEAVVTKDEVQHLTFLCKSEIDSIGRITAGVIRLLKLEGSIGQSVIDQLGHLGELSNYALNCFSLDIKSV